MADFFEEQQREAFRRAEAERQRAAARDHLTHLVYDALVASADADVAALYAKHAQPAGVGKGEFMLLVAEQRDRLRNSIAAREREARIEERRKLLISQVAKDVTDLPGITFSELKRKHDDVTADDIVVAISALKDDYKVEAVYSDGEVAYYPPGAGISSHADIPDLLRRLIISNERMERRIAQIEAVTVAKLVPTGPGRPSKS